MAVTSIWAIKGKADGVINYAVNPEKVIESNPEAVSNLHSIDNLILYTTDEIKTEKCLYVSGINCEPETAIQDFKDTKEHWQKKGGIVAYHAIQSFADGEVTPDIAHKIGRSLAKKLWGERFEVVVATHANTTHIHNHFVINSVSLFDGHKYNDCKETYRFMREESDRLCKEYGLSVIRRPREKRKNYGEWLAEKEGRPTVRSAIREAIDMAARGSTTETEFLDAMSEMGFIIDKTGKYPKIKHIGNERFVRFDSLGPNYSYDEILDDVYENYHPEYPNFPEQQSPQKIFEGLDGSPATYGYYAVYHCYYKALKITHAQPDENRRLFLFVRQDHNHMRDYSDKTRLLTEHKIGTQAELYAYKENTEEKMKEEYSKRTELRNAYKRASRAGDVTECSRLSSQIAICSQNISVLRNELKMCNSVVDEVEQLRDKLRRIQAEKFRGKEETRDEHIRRSSRSGFENEPRRN